MLPATKNNGRSNDTDPQMNRSAALKQEPDMFHCFYLHYVEAFTPYVGVAAEAWR